MSPRAKKVFEAQRLQDEFDVYDKHVDVVSAFEWIFNESKELPAHVTHFERYPTIDDNGTDRTPDFTILFNDGTAIIGEISSLALHANSIEKACAQIANYAPLTSVPGPDGKPHPVTHLDVMLIVPSESGPRAVDEIILNRMHDPDHDYKPPSAPCIVQFTRTESKYILQRIRDAANGHLDPGDRTPHIEDFLNGGLNIPARKFQGVKAARRFMNDPVPALYLATHLWVSTWPTQHGASRDTITVDPAATAATLRQQFGAVKASDVRHALDLFHAAGLATKQPDNTWTVSRKPLRSRTEKDVAKIIAERAAKNVKIEPAVRPRPNTDYTQERLFD
jgi:hypothetical protein